MKAPPPRLAPLLFGLLAVLLAPVAQAQAPHALNAPPLPSAEADRLAAFEARLGHSGGTPDTTAPWRYYPLAVGNAWEYENYDGWVQRKEVVGDTLALGQRYFVLRNRIHDGTTVTADHRYVIRYDTTAAIVYALRVDGVELPFVICPLDLPFDVKVECDLTTVFVTGDYDGVLVFGGDTPGTGTDTVRTAYKRYETIFGIETIYAADVGEVFNGGEGGFWALTYYRNEEEEHGVSQWPVANEQGPPGSGEEAMTLSAWPNPTRGPLTLALRLDRPAQVEAALYDMLGRRVAVLHAGRLGAGEHALPLDASRLPPGVYVVRAQAGEVRAARQVVVLGR